MWKATVDYFKYDYTILGREIIWHDFNTKIKEYLYALRNLNCDCQYDYVLLADCLDLFFVAREEELITKFEQLGKKYIVGGEINFHCPGIRYSPVEVESYLRNSPGIYCCINSGFIMVHQR